MEEYEFIIAMALLLFVVVCWIVSALLFMWAWNLLLPLLWAAAPHIGFWQAIAGGVLLGTLRGLFQFTVNNTKTL